MERFAAEEHSLKNLHRGIMILSKSNSTRSMSHSKLPSYDGLERMESAPMSEARDLDVNPDSTFFALCVPECRI